MKTGQTQKDVTEMHFDRVTLVRGQRGDKCYMPVNPEAKIVAVKGSEVPAAVGASVEGQSKESLIINALSTIGQHLGFGKKADIDDIVGDATENALQGAMLSCIYDFEYAVASIIWNDLFDDGAKTCAINSALETMTLTLGQLMPQVLAEKAQAFAAAEKAGARHNAKDKADIADAHKAAGDALEKLQAAHDALGRLNSDNTPAPAPAAKAATDAPTSGTSAPSTQGDPEMNDAEKAAFAAQVATAVGTSVAEAIKAATKPAEAATTATETPVATPTAAIEAAATKSAEVIALEAKLADALAAKAKAEADLVEAAQKGSAAAAGHADPTEVTPGAAREAQAELAKKAVATGSLRDAITTLCATKTSKA